MEKRHIGSISVISSAVCNLNCSFCYLHKNTAYKAYDELVRKAWHDGSYVENLAKTMEAIGADFNDVTVFQLWGGETLLHVEDITENLKAIYNYFPKINEWKISTNWIIDVNKVFEFVKEINECAKTKTRIMMQVSIDGPPGVITERGHHGDWNIYKKNFENFTHLMNNCKLKNIDLHFQVNSTIAKDVFFNELDTYEKIRDYVTYMRDFFFDVKDMCISESIDMGSIFFFPGLATPNLESIEDGEKFASICRIWERVRLREFPEIPLRFPFLNGTAQLIGERYLIEKNVECGELMNSLTINYDGTICECSGSYIDDYPPYLEEIAKEGMTKELQTAKLRSFVTYNPSQLTKEELEKKDWYILNGYKNNSLTYLHLMMEACNELALSGQIPSVFLHDKEKLLNYIISLSFGISCTRDNIATTRTPYMVVPDVFRRLLNGAGQEAYDVNCNIKKEDLKNQVQDAIDKRRGRRPEDRERRKGEV